MRGRELVGAACQALGPDVRVMPVKGILFGALGLVDPADRLIQDVDLLVHGLTLRGAAGRLQRSGFVITDIPVASGKLTLTPARDLSLSIDLHTHVAPLGVGRLRPEYLFEGATLRNDLFPAPIYVATLPKLALHAIANIVKDRVVHAEPHVARDVVMLLSALDRRQLENLSPELRKLALANAAALALSWVQRLEPNDRVEAVLDQLVGHEARRIVTKRLEQMERADRFDLLSRIRARACADTMLLRVLATAGAGVDLVTWPARNIWLRT